MTRVFQETLHTKMSLRSGKVLSEKIQKIAKEDGPKSLNVLQRVELAFKRERTKCIRKLQKVTSLMLNFLLKVIPPRAQLSKDTPSLVPNVTMKMVMYKW